MQCDWLRLLFNKVDERVSPATCWDSFSLEGWCVWLQTQLLRYAVWLTPSAFQQSRWAGLTCNLLRLLQLRGLMCMTPNAVVLTWIHKVFMWINSSFIQKSKLLFVFTYTYTYLQYNYSHTFTSNNFRFTSFDFLNLSIIARCTNRIMNLLLHPS